jgi:hypothetical protein
MARAHQDAAGAWLTPGLVWWLWDSEEKLRERALCRGCCLAFWLARNPILLAALVAGRQRQRTSSEPVEIRFRLPARPSKGAGTRKAWWNSSGSLALFSAAGALKRRLFQAALSLEAFGRASRVC